MRPGNLDSPSSAAEGGSIRSCTGRETHLSLPGPDIAKNSPLDSTVGGGICVTRSLPWGSSLKSKDFGWAEEICMSRGKKSVFLSERGGVWPPPIGLLPLFPSNPSLTLPIDRT